MAARKSAALCPKCFIGIVQRAINYTAPSPVVPPKKFSFFFYIATPLLCMVLDSCLVLHKKSSCLPALQQPAISTYKICSFIYLAYSSSSSSSSNTYTYSLKNVSFGMWLLKSRNIWKGDKNWKRERKNEKLQMEGKSKWNFLGTYYPSSTSQEGYSSLLLSSHLPSWEPRNSHR